ncbi:MAG TPA: 50S ribosomal protein L24 [Verrucomicrobiae bacterium]|nr:50S ribosomal protein L24 [Verrucomicrobiae bacterium]
MKMSLKKGDSVLVIAGREKGKRGVVEKVISESNRVIVTGINLRKRHLKPSQKHPRGGIVELATAMHCSNVMPIDPATEKPVRANKIERTK